MAPDDAASDLPQRLRALQARYPELPLPPDAGDPGSPWALPPPLAVPAGTPLFAEQSPCQGFPLVLDGEVRVARGAPDGRSLELYRVGPGEVCVVSASSLFGQVPMPAHGVAASACTLVLLSPAVFEAWCAHAPFRRHILGLFSDRLAEVITLAEAVAFQRLDQRLAAALLGHGTVVQATHQALADELGTVREIVSRLLRRFARAGWIEAGRERITLTDPAALRRVAAGAGWRS